MSLISVLRKIMEQIPVEVRSRHIQYRVLIRNRQNNLTKDKLCLTTLVASSDGEIATVIRED